MTWTLAAMLTCAITLGGCGGGSTPQEPTAQEDAIVAEQDAANPDEQTEQANPAEKFVASWKFAYLQEDGVTVIDLLVLCGLAKSKGEARRLIQQGGVSVDGDKVTELEAAVSKDKLEAGAVIKKGKKVYHKAILK
jgi:tyrosyl-tRNA synthetase